MVLLMPASVSAASGDTTADVVFGQPNFNTNSANNGGVSANGLDSAAGVIFDTAGRLYITDLRNNRILTFTSPGASDTTADSVLGQPNMGSNTSNNGGLAGFGLSTPTSGAFNKNGRLFVVDQANHRILVFHSITASDTTADTVLGQPNFDTNSANHLGISRNSLSSPSSIVFDAENRLYVSDQGNNRVLIFNDPTGGDTAADTVLGQPRFDTNSLITDTISSHVLAAPEGLAIDAEGRLYVADKTNSRVLIYDNVISGDTLADTVLGQPGFDSNIANNGGVSATSLSRPRGISTDTQGRIYVADAGNHRILVYISLTATDSAADAIIGQASFTSNTANASGISSQGLNRPVAITFDSQGQLYVADQDNNRVLRFANVDSIIVISSDTSASSDLSSDSSSFCILSRLIASRFGFELGFMRKTRDFLLKSSSGRLIIALYYHFFG
ncbi:MAG: NHL repeat-containing protein [Candidatus Lindowbacteria bacterium]|nr:NHL repeat-containing protein [Candidatus Lindowbacteria bacterium]